jgi:hypothetical protein
LELPQQTSGTENSSPTIPVLTTLNPSLFTVKAFAAKHAAAGFTEGSLRAIIFDASPRASSQGTIPGNGFGCAIVRVGRKVLIDEPRFFDVIRAKQTQGVR